jgi:hypothetical protein|tara:strand:- start:1155 stop:1394 length:240 start_codon:yes stop_codon:yes gene_type:complete
MKSHEKPFEIMTWADLEHRYNNSMNNELQIKAIKDSICQLIEEKFNTLDRQLSEIECDIAATMDEVKQLKATALRQYSR